MFKWAPKMNSDDFLFYTITLLVGVLLFMLLSMPSKDMRDFSDIVTQCESMGYIQDEIVRVKCSVEK